MWHLEVYELDGTVFNCHAFFEQNLLMEVLQGYMNGWGREESYTYRIFYKR
jgi:hypothetical protein